jgi:peptidoglycan/xylan/chitin deacetylase (PgdA/CDA1 family)
MTNLLARRRRGLLVLNYHRIRPDGEFETPFDEEVFGPSVSEFEAQLKWVAARFRILSESELIDIIASGSYPNEPAAMITFDDGYQDNYTRARPALKRNGVPAIFFVPTQLIEERKLGWWDHIAYLVKRSPRRSAHFQGRSLELADRPAAIRELLGLMKLRPERETRDLVASLGPALDVEPPTKAEESAELMTWADLKACSEDGITIGSHSHSHRVLATLSIEEQQAELCMARELIASRLGLQVRSLAYPVGGPEHFTQDTMRLAADSGLEVGFSYGGRGCFNRWEAFQRFDIHRLALPNTAALTAATAALPEVFSI